MEMRPMPQSAQAAISRYPVPALDAMPEDIRARILKVQEKTGFIPNVFLMLAYRPDEFRAFIAYHDALMEGGRAHQSRARNDRGRDLGGQRVPVLRHCPRGDPADPRQKPIS